MAERKQKLENKQQIVSLCKHSMREMDAIVIDCFNLTLDLVLIMVSTDVENIILYTLSWIIFWSLEFKI